MTTDTLAHPAASLAVLQQNAGATSVLAQVTTSLKTSAPIPAVIHKKTFKSELLAFENESSLSLTGPKELVARTADKEKDSYLLETSAEVASQLITA